VFSFDIGRRPFPKADSVGCRTCYALPMDFDEVDIRQGVPDYCRRRKRADLGDVRQVQIPGRDKLRPGILRVA